MDEIYCYPNTDILKNKFNITDDVKLSELERKLSFQNQLEIVNDTTVVSKFDFEYFKSIHKKIFGEIYDWAGKPRTVNISKRNSMFCRSEYIESEAKDIFAKLKKDNFLQGISKDAFIDKLAFYAGDINALHPFREGNGRTQRTFFMKLAQANGYHIAYDAVDKGLLIHADVLAMRGSYDLLKEILNEIVEKVPEPINKKSMKDIISEAKQKSESQSYKNKKDTPKRSSKDLIQ